MSHAGHRLLRAGALSDRGLRGRQASHGNPKRAARHVVQAELVAEMDRVRVTTMLAAYADLQVRPRLAPFRHGHRHQPADAVLVDRFEWIAREDLALEVADDEVALRVVA